MSLNHGLPFHAADFSPHVMDNSDLSVGDAKMRHHHVSFGGPWDVPATGPIDDEPPPAPPPKVRPAREPLPQYGSPYLCYPMVGLKTPDGAQATPSLQGIAIPDTHIAGMFLHPPALQAASSTLHKKRRCGFL